MKFIVCVLFTVLHLVIFESYAQKNTQEYMEEGIQYHEKGNFEKAIETYEEGLKSFPRSADLHYELAYVYYDLKNYKQTIKHCDKALKIDKKHILSYVLKGSCLDNMGKFNESIAVFEKGIKETEGNFSLFYNLAINYLGRNNLNKAEEYTIKAIRDNPVHGSSHFMLAKIQEARGNKTQKFLCLNFFLLLESNSPRSMEAYKMLSKMLLPEAKNSSDSTTVPVTIDISKKNDFQTTEFIITMMEATVQVQRKEGKSEDEIFMTSSKVILASFKETNIEQTKSIYNELYIPFFNKLIESEHYETFFRIISRSINETSQQWVSENGEKIIEFEKWLSGKE